MPPDLHTVYFHADMYCFGLKMQNLCKTCFIWQHKCLFLWILNTIVDLFFFFLLISFWFKRVNELHALLNVFCVNGWSEILNPVSLHVRLPGHRWLHSFVSDWKLDKKCTGKNSCGKVLEVLIRWKNTSPLSRLDPFNWPTSAAASASAAMFEILHHRCSGDLGFARGFFPLFFPRVASVLFKEPSLTPRFDFLQRLV